MKTTFVSPKLITLRFPKPGSVAEPVVREFALVSSVCLQLPF